MAAGLDPVETLAGRVALDGSSPQYLLGRGWSEEQWQAARERLAERGWLTGDGTATDDARAGFQAIEDATDRAAAHPWQALGPDDTDRLRELLEPIARAGHTLLPEGSPLGLPALPG